jgi:SAM-dependent methyltransferase
VSDPPRPRPLTYAGLLLVTLATLMFEILLTRIFSVTMWYHFAFMAISIAMFGMTVGAIWVFLRPQNFSGESAPRQLAHHALLFAGSLVICFLLYLRVPFIGDTSLKGIAFLALSYLLIAVPFVFSGVTVTVALTKFPGHIEKLYAADLVGAGLGCVALIYTLDLTDAGAAMFVVGALAALGAACFGLAAAEPVLRRRALIAAAVLGGSAVGLTTCAERNQPVINITDTAALKNDAYVSVRWNSHSRVTVSGNPDVPQDAGGWGLSEKSGATKAQVRQLSMTIDTWAGTVITNFDGNTEPLFYLKDDVTNIAHYLRRDADVFVVGVGGGRDVLSALVFGQKSVTGVEINRNVLRSVTHDFHDFAGNLGRHPKVKLAVDEARSYITRSPGLYDIIQLSLIDTWAATAAGAFVLTENSLYTTEAWTTFLSHLKPGGVLTVSRWYYPSRPGEALRIASLAREALVRVGVQDPRSHVLLIKAPKAGGLSGALGNGVATILVGRSPFSDAEIAVLDQQLDRLGFEFLVTPRLSADPAYDKILDPQAARAFYESYPLDISAPTDDKPFFFQMLRLGDVTRSLAINWFDPNKANLESIRLLAALLVIVSVLTVLCIFIPLALSTKKSVLKGSSPHLMFFLSIGLGFMFVEISQMQRLMLFLGHPTYALSVVLFTLLVGGGLGSFSSGRLIKQGGPLKPQLALGLTILVLVAVGILTPFLTKGLASAGTPVRIVTAAGILLVVGWFLGLPFPLGMRAAAARGSDLTPWLWGINGAASVLCSVLAIVVALSAGIAASFWIGVGCYGSAFVAYFLATRAPAKEPALSESAASVVG